MLARFFGIFLLCGRYCLSEIAVMQNKSADEKDYSFDIDDFRRYATLKEHYVENPQECSFPGTFVGLDDGFDLDRFKQDLGIKITRLEGLDCEFDIFGVHPSLVNAFRRILLAEVPTMAIEKVFIKNNTSIIQDEVLAHRLGLIPIQTDPRLFEMPSEFDGKNPETAKAEENLVFKLKLKCKKNAAAPPKSTDPDELYIDHKVYSGSLIWKPIGNQSDKFSSDKIPRMVDDNILIAKMRPGHEIDLKAYAVKGVGQDHAKFSPVATATYRLLPEIELLDEVQGDLADEMVSCFSDGVMRVVGQGNERRATIVNSRLDTGSREVFRHEHLRDLVRMRKRKDYFLFSIESTGALAPDTLMMEAINVLRAKCQSMLQAVKQHQKGGMGEKSTKAASSSSSSQSATTPAAQSRTGRSTKNR